jgi:hypothetical protein
VMVALVTERAHTERTVRLAVGDHPYINHSSNVDFGTATFAPTNKLIQGIAKKAAIHHDPMSAALLAKVRAGLLQSSHTPNALKEHCRTIF